GSHDTSGEALCPNGGGKGKCKHTRSQHAQTFHGNLPVVNRNFHFCFPQRAIIHPTAPAWAGFLSFSIPSDSDGPGKGPGRLLRVRKMAARAYCSNFSDPSPSPLIPPTLSRPRGFGRAIKKGDLTADWDPEMARSNYRVAQLRG